MGDLLYIEPCLRPIVAFLLVVLLVLVVTFLYATWRKD
jgi:hypothetical protein